MSDWLTIMQRRIQDEALKEKFYESVAYEKAFIEWDSETHPEEYGND